MVVISNNNKEFFNTPLSFAAQFSDYPYKLPKHLRIIDSLLIDLYESKLNKLIINLPPRHGKSELISKIFPAWWLHNNPRHKIILASYGADFASEWSQKSKQVYTNLGVPLKVSKSNRFVNIYDGEMYATGVGGTTTGKGADVFIVDDPVKNADESFSKTIREKTWNWFQSTAYTRREPNSKFIVIQTRWHYDDLTGRILENDVNKEWTVIKFPALDENNNPLWPERFDYNALMDIKRVLGAYFFSALYQQEPTASEVQIVKNEWLQFYDYDVTNPDMIFRSWDTALKDDENNDYTVITEWYIKNNNLYLNDMIREKLQTPDLIELAKDLYKRQKTAYDVIENSTPGIALIQMLKQQTDIPVKPFSVGGSKRLRLSIASSLFEQGKVFIKKAHWNEVMTKELLNFPNDKHDDIVDSISQAVIFGRDYLFQAEQFSAYDILKLTSENKNNIYNLNFRN